MTTKPKRPAPKRAKHATNTLKGASPISGVPPPEATKWKPGQPSPNPHGRPRKLADLQELIRDTLAEEMSATDPATGRSIRMTRAQAMIRTMLIKSPSDRIALLEYAFGKVPQAIEIDIYTSIASELHITIEEARAKVEQAADALAPMIGDIMTGKVKAEKSQRESNG